jgi:hypothetical protein
MKKANVLARHYDRLTPEERFRLIVAAGARGDKAEQERLVRAGQRLTLSVQDHAPYAHAFNELAWLVFMELLEEAAHYVDLFARAGGIGVGLGANEEKDEGEVEEGKVNSTEEAASEAKADAESTEHEAGEWAFYERYLDQALAAGFLLRTKAEGWKRFCERLTVPPFVFWEGLPGFERLQHALQLSAKAAFVPEGFLRWLNGIRPAGEPEQVQVPLTAEGVATAMEEAFRERVQWWGG